MRFVEIVGRSLAAATCLATFAAVAPAYADEDGKSLTRKLIDTEAQVALQKLEQDLTKGAPPAAVVATPTPAVVKAQAERARPRTIALYGVDGRAAGGVLSLRSYVQWGGETHAAHVGSKWRGYTVSSISESGTTLTKGKSKVFAPYEQDDSVNLVDPTQETGGASGARPAGPLPSAVAGSAAASNGPMPMMPPQLPAQFPGQLPLNAAPAPAGLPSAPVTPSVPVGPAAAANVALR